MKLRKFFTRNNQNLNQKYYYNKYFWYKIWKFDDTHSLQVDIYSPPISKEKYKTFLEKAYGKLDEYLSILNNVSETPQSLYNSLINFIGLYPEEILDDEKIVFSLMENINGQQLVVSKIKLFKGTIEEYSVLEHGQKYTVNKNGDWSYLSNAIFIKYVDALNNCSFSATRDENDPSTIIQRVKERIFELQKFVQ